MDRQMQVWSALARTVGDRKVAFDDAGEALKADNPSLKHENVEADQSPGAAHRSPQAFLADLQATVDLAQRSLDHARKMWAQDAANLEKQVTQASHHLARAQTAAQSPQATVDRARELLDAAKARQVQNAHAYQAAVDRARQRLVDAQTRLSYDLGQLASAQVDRDRYQNQAGSLQTKVDRQQAKVDADKYALDSCRANALPEGCSSLQKGYDNDTAALNDLESSLSAAESHLVAVTATISTLEDTLAGDQSSLASGQRSLTGAQQAQSSGLARDARTVQDAKAALANARETADSSAPERQRSLASAKQALASISHESRSRLADDRRTVRDAEASLAEARHQVQSIRPAADSLARAEQSLASALASNASFVPAPTAGDLAIAEIKVKLARLAVAKARATLVVGRGRTAPASGTMTSQLEQRLRAQLSAAQKVALREHAGVVGIARQYLGIPYVWGGASPTTGFDCSGFVLFVYAQVRISLPHYAAAQYDYGAPVSRDRLQPGDLVFFDGANHVGIYVGNGEFIQAPGTGDVVKISNLDEPDYATAYAGARRLESASR